MIVNAENLYWTGTKFGPLADAIRFMPSESARAEDTRRNLWKQGFNGLEVVTV